MRITASPSNSGSESSDEAPSQSLAIEDGVLAIEPGGEAPHGRSKSGKALPAPIVSWGGRFGGRQSCKSPKHCDCGGWCRTKYEEEWPHHWKRWAIYSCEGEEIWCNYMTWKRAGQRLVAEERSRIQLAGRETGRCTGRNSDRGRMPRGRSTPPARRSTGRPVRGWTSRLF